MLRQTQILLKHLLLNEWRQLYAVMALLLQVVSSIFVLYLAAKFLDKAAWNALYWVLLLFLSINAVGRSFIQESKGRLMYYYQLCSPSAIIISRIIYNTILVLFISLLSLFLYSVWMGNPIEKPGLYTLVICLAAIGYSSVLTLMSAISSHAGNSHIIMPVLSFPVIIPLLSLSVHAAKQAMDGIDSGLIYQNIVYMCSLDLIIFGMAYILFPFLWKD
ncbi:MAG: ABC transporter permease [Bacteroidota bacterium]|nr:ABC transporter permease [Bacteroidota bacterium]